MKFKNPLKKLFCNHNTKLIFIRNIYGDEINQLNARSIWRCSDCNKLIYKNILYDTGKISDGYHTFDELYHHKTILFAVICSIYKDMCWKSYRHHPQDDEIYPNMFIVGINTPEGTATYHVDIKYWDSFNVPIYIHAPKWDGHTPDEAIKRISSLIGYDIDRDKKYRVIHRNFN